MRKLLGWLIISLLIGSALLYWGAKELVHEILNPKEATEQTTESTPAAQTMLQVDVVPVRAQKLAQQVTAVGSLLAQNAVMVRAENGGRIAQILFNEGAPVRAGALLVQLDTEILEAELKQAQAQLQLAQSRAHRAQQLSQQGFISAQAQDESKSEQAVAAAQVQIIKTKIDKSQIKAPFDGVLGLRYVSVGDYVATGTDIVSLASIDQLQVDFRIPEQYLTQVTVGTTIRLRLDAQSDQDFMGQVNVISPIIDEQGRSVLLRAHVPNTSGQLRPGQFARVVLDLNEIDAMMVPETALSPSGQAQYIYRVDDSGKAERIEVSVGIRRDGWVQVIGLESNDVVLTTGLQKVRPGDQLQYELSEVQSGAAAPTKG